MDYYEILGINRSATDEEIRRAYKKMAMKYHPDKTGDGNSEKFKDISVAYETLSDKRKRQIYDIGGNVDIMDDIDMKKAFNIFENVFASFNSMGGISSMNNFDGGFIFTTTMPMYMSPDEIFAEQICVDEKQVNNSIENNRFKKRKDKTYNLNVRLEDIYMRKTKKLKVKEGKFDIPLHHQVVVFSIDNGEVTFNIYEKPHERFRRIGEKNLLYYVEIDMKDVYSGYILELEHLDGKIYKIYMGSNKLCCQNHTNLIVKGLGIDGGNLILNYNVKIPNKDELKKIVDEEVIMLEKSDEMYDVEECDRDIIYIE